MPVQTLLLNVNFEIQPDEMGGAAVLFRDPQSGAIFVIPFDADAWKNFQRAVAGGGTSPIAIAKVIPG